VETITDGGADIFGALFHAIDQAGITMVQNLYTAFANALGPIFVVGMTIYIVWLGYQLMIGKMGLTAGSIIWTIGRMMFIYAIAFYWGTFSPLVAQTAIAGPDAIAVVICQGAGGQSCQSSDDSGSSGTTQGLSAIWNAGVSVGTKVSMAGGWTGVGLMIAGLVVMIIVGLMVAIGAALLVMSKVALFIILATAPIFISMALFQFSSGLFTGWMTTLFQYSLVLPCVVYGIMGVMLVFIKSQADQLVAASQFELTTVAPFLVMCGVCAYLLLQAQNIAHGIGGGARLDGSRMMADAARAIGIGGRHGVSTMATGTRVIASNSSWAATQLLSQQTASLQAARRASRS
jgi:type IV secretion system protein VirB6